MISTIEADCIEYQAICQSIKINPIILFACFSFDTILTPEVLACTLSVERASMHTIVFTGGPAGGKSTSLRAIKDEYGDKVILVPEVATMLMEGGFPIPNKDMPYSQEWQEAFQPAVLCTQQGIEDMNIRIAKQKGARLVICDRGILDGAAYVTGGIPAFLSEYGLDLHDCYSRYTQVVHFESTATCNPSLYGKTGNESRYENLDEAIALEHRIRKVWQEHPNWTFISGEGGIAQVIARALSIVSSYVDVEIERKFVLRDVPEFPAYDRKVLVQQGYLATDPGELRIRRIGDAAFIASKGDGAIRRDEWERPLPRDTFDRLWQKTSGAQVTKTRYFIPYGKYMLELDVYQGAHRGLVTLECEFASESEAAAFGLPYWAADAMEVTDDLQFKNKNLAIRGLPVLPCR